jgi:hypothetical protein
MFPHPNRPDSSAHAWLDAIRHGLDLVVAFATLRDAGEPRSSDGMDPGDAGHWPRADEIPPVTAAGRRRAAQRRAERNPARSERPEPPVHPHRRPLRPAARLRRPGLVRPEPQPCLTPIVPRRLRATRTLSRGARHA